MIEVTLSELEERIGYKFNNESILKEALTHSSYSNEQKARKVNIPCNERLEFLGDSVLSIIVSEYLYNNYRGVPEGELTKLRAAVVQSSALACYARKVDLGKALYLGVGEEKCNGRERQSLLENAFEALLAAIYLDAGAEGKRRVSDFLMPLVKEELERLGTRAVSSDYKTELQQLIQQAEGDFLEYETVGESGPDHQKTFEVVAKLNSNVIGRGKGRTKREAEQNAAKEALELFGAIK